MDKIAANNHFVVLRKEVKKAKAMVSGNLIRKITKLRKEIDQTTDEAVIKRLEGKISAIHEEIRMLKTLDTYAIAKSGTLKPDVKYWEKLIGDSKATPDERLIARVLDKNNVQKQIAKFRDDHRDCDEWLNEYIEYREKKKELLEVANKARKKKFKNSKSGDERRRSKSAKKNDKSISHDDSTPKQDISEKKLKSNDNKKDELESLHPSWASKRREKEILRAALAGEIPQSKRIILDSS